MDIIPLILFIAAIAAYSVQWLKPQGNRFALAGAAVHILALVGWLVDKPVLHLWLLLSLFMPAALLLCWRSLVFITMRRLLLLLTAAAVLAPLVLPVTRPAAVSLHSLLALAVYTLAGAAFVLCLDLRLAERQLRRQPQQAGQVPLLGREQQYFTYVLLSFIVLTLTLASGLATALAGGQEAFALTHKQLFAYLTWLVLLTLLLGRRFFGWRGQAAQRWFFFAYAFLLLSYIGSTAIAQWLSG